MNFEVCILGSADIARLRAMSAMFGRAFDAVRTYTQDAPDDAYLGRLLSSETFVAVAAIANGEVVGGIAAYVLPKFEQPRSELYIYDLAVDERHRRRGVATAMLERLRALAAARGVSVLYVQADRDDAAAIALYTKLGAREDVLHFDIEPRPSPD